MPLYLRKMAVSFYHLLKLQTTEMMGYTTSTQMVGLRASLFRRGRVTSENPSRDKYIECHGCRRQANVRSLALVLRVVYGSCRCKASKHARRRIVARFRLEQGRDLQQTGGDVRGRGLEKRRESNELRTGSTKSVRD